MSIPTEERRDAEGQDIAERLRHLSVAWQNNGDTPLSMTLREAADEIEYLRMPIDPAAEREKALEEAARMVESRAVMWETAASKANEGGFGDTAFSCARRAQELRHAAGAIRALKHSQSSAAPQSERNS